MARQTLAVHYSEQSSPADPVDLAADQSFPASDPPCWTGTHARASIADAERLGGVGTGPAAMRSSKKTQRR
jgi:hypothetical protein